MKTFYKLVFGGLFALLLCTACIRHGRGLCMEPTLVQLDYFADGDTDVFSEHIRCVEYFLYDEQGTLVLKQQLTSESLQKQEIALNLPSGEYTLVAWGNRTELSSYVDIEQFSTGRLQVANYDSQLPIRGSDRLYYAKQNLTIQLGQTAIYPLHFESAHYNFNIYVNGLEQTPSLEVQNLPAQYDMNKLLITETNTSYQPEIDYHPEKERYVYSFSAFRFYDDSPVTFVLQDSELSQPLIFRLDELLANQDPPLSLEDKQEVLIPIEIDYDELQISISLPDWDKEPSTPGVE